MSGQSRICLIGRGLAMLVFAAWPLVGATQTKDPQLVNGDFKQWDRSGPVGWTLEIGATNGANQPLSQVRQGDGPSLELSGDRSTLAWQSVGQKLAVKPGDALRLSYEVKTTDLRREGNQYDNCFVGVFQKDRRGKEVARNLWQNNISEYTEVTNVIGIQPGASVAQVVIFLSKSGTLNVRNVRVERLKPEDSFDILVADMDRHYSFFEHKGIDWPALVEKYRARAEAAETPPEFIEVITGMLAELEDVHTWVTHKGKQHYPKIGGASPGNYDFRVVDRELASKSAVGRFAVVGKTSDGLGYVRINTLSNVKPAALKKLIAATERLFDAPGLIIDLRANGGGAEGVASQFVSLLADESRIYARQQFRAGPGHDQFYESQARSIGPREGKTFTGPIVCLIGPRAVSSAEGMALMMAALPHCTLVGQPTRGASGNPQPVSLPNGVDVWYSRWMALTPDGTPIEGVGVQPDVVVEQGKGDPAWEKAVEILLDR